MIKQDWIEKIYGDIFAVRRPVVSKKAFKLIKENLSVRHVDTLDEGPSVEDLLVKTNVQ